LPGSVTGDREDQPEKLPPRKRA